MDKKKIIWSHYQQYLSILHDIKQKAIACTDSDMKQYIMYFMCVRAKFWMIDESDLHGMLSEIVDAEDNGNSIPLTKYQYQLALTGFKDKRKISNKRFQEKTGLAIYGKESLTMKECFKEFRADDKFYCYQKRVELLKRLVKRKNKITEREILEYFDKHGVKISRTSFRKDNIYRAINSDMYRDGILKVIKSGNDYVIKS